MSSQLDYVFHSLSDETRRDILRRLTSQELSVSEIAEPYDMSLPAVSKHLAVLENSNLIMRRREGKKYMIRSNPEELKQIDDWIEFFRKFWNESFDNMDTYLATIQKGEE